MGLEALICNVRAIIFKCNLRCKPITASLAQAGGHVCKSSCSGSRMEIQSAFKERMILHWTIQNLMKWTNHQVIKKTLSRLNEKMDVLGQVFALNCNAIVAQRIRRGTQIVNLYSKIYNECVMRYFLARFGQRIIRNSKGNRVPLLFGATLFSWAQERVSQDEIQDCVNEVLPSQNDSPTQDNMPGSVFECVGRHVSADGWEKIIDRDHLQTWRKPLPQSPHLYQYKVCGTFHDIPARAFFAVQLDLAYRKKWDRLVISLDCVDRDRSEDNSEVVRWVTHYPYPMYSREYVYVRRYHVDTENNVMVLVSRAVDHPDYPVCDNYVRVHTYQSSMVVRPHASFDENGLDYVLTYHDDPQAAFPSLAYNWMASTGVPDFVEKLHVAARNLILRNRNYRPNVSDHSEPVACYS